jgi:hypothetical protein
MTDIQRAILHLIRAGRRTPSEICPQLAAMGFWFPRFRFHWNVGELVELKYLVYSDTGAFRITGRGSVVLNDRYDV